MEFHNLRLKKELIAFQGRRQVNWISLRSIDSSIGSAIFRRAALYANTRRRVRSITPSLWTLGLPMRPFGRRVSKLFVLLL